MTSPTLGAASCRRVLAVCFCASLSVVAIAPSAAAQKGPAPATVGLPADVIGLACAPSLAREVPVVPLRVTGGQDSARRVSFAPGDLVTINAGTKNGMTVGQQFYTRRLLVRGRITADNPAVVRTTGWIRVYAVDDDLSLATITHSCDTVDVDDYLEPFTVPAVPTPASVSGPAERDNYGRVLVGQDRRTAFGQGDYIVIDRGSNQGVAPGTRFVLYHDKQQADNFLFQLGEAVAVDVRPDSSTVRVLSAIDSIQAGDYVAIRK